MKIAEVRTCVPSFRFSFSFSQSKLIQSFPCRTTTSPSSSRNLPGTVSTTTATGRRRIWRSSRRQRFSSSNGGASFFFLFHLRLPLTSLAFCRRSWFPERLLKLGQVQILREYACHSACDDPSRCARLVSEKWGSAFSATFRFGTPQPCVFAFLSHFTPLNSIFISSRSIIYRSLRSLEPSLSSPALHLPFTSCQNHARLWVAE
jgi:hypothetical protein